MKNTLIIVNYMRTNPTIVDDLVRLTNSYYDKIIVVNRNTNDNYSNIINYKNVLIKEVKAFNRFLLIPKTLFSIRRTEIIDDLLFALRMKRINFKMLLEYYKNLHVSNLLLSVLGKINDLKTNPEDITLLSVWFSNEAYSISLIKKKYPKVKAFSMAHAHEVETSDNLNTFWFKKFCHEHIDRIIFISKNKIKAYSQHVTTPRNISLEKIKLLYWGSSYIKFYENYDIELTSKMQKHIIVSCSTVEELKRVELIADTFLFLNDNVTWVHFGDGLLFNKLHEKIIGYPENLKKRIFLVGRKHNDFVKNFYYYNNVDLFINVSTTEGLPISVMEALSYSIPALVTNVGGEDEIITDNYNGYLINKDITPDFLSILINKHLSLDTSARIQMSKNAREVWEKKFNLDNNINQFINIINNVE